MAAPSTPNPITKITPQNIQNLSFDKEFNVLVVEMVGYDGANLVRVAVNSSGELLVT